MKNLEFKEKISHGTKFFPFAYYSVTHIHPRYTMTVHWHEECELVRIIKGSFNLKINTKSYHLSEGDVAFINSGFIHSGIPKNCIYECLVFDISFLKKERSFSNSFLNSLISFQKEIKIIYTKENKNILKIFDKIFTLIKNEKKGFEMKIFGLFYYFLGIIEEEDLFSNKINIDFNNKRKLIHLKKVLSVIQKKYMYNISLEDLASSIDMNTNYFCKFFKELTNKTPMEYLNYYRVECAKERLKESNLSITEIAYDCGFNDISYFTKVFKKYNDNLTPRDFLKLYKKN